MDTFEELNQTIQQGKRPETRSLVERLLNQGVSPQEIIEKGIIAALDIVGKKFSKGECFIPEMLVAARASQTGLEILKPLILRADQEKKGKVVIGTVKGDLHDIGKNVVAMMFQAGGFEVTDLGVDVPPERFVETIRSIKPQILAMSCLLTTTMNSMRVTMDHLKEAGLRDHVAVLIGGPPTNDDFARRIGADRYGKDAYEGVAIARQLARLS